MSYDTPSGCVVSSTAFLPFSSSPSWMIQGHCSHGVIDAMPSDWTVDEWTKLRSWLSHCPTHNICPTKDFVNFHLQNSMVFAEGALRNHYTPYIMLFQTSLETPLSSAQLHEQRLQEQRRAPHGQCQPARGPAPTMSSVSTKLHASLMNSSHSDVRTSIEFSWSTEESRSVSRINRLITLEEQ